LPFKNQGRLQEDSLQLLSEAACPLAMDGTQLKAQARIFPTEILFLRDDDIHNMWKIRLADVGIVGENIFVGKAKEKMTL